MQRLRGLIAPPIVSRLTAIFLSRFMLDLRGLYFSEEEMLEFTPAFSGMDDLVVQITRAVTDSAIDVYSDALLSAHEAEIARLEALKQQRAPILASVDKYRSLVKDREDLNASSQDASRLLAKACRARGKTP